MVGLRSLLSLAPVYASFQKLAGNDRLRHAYVRDVVRPRPGDAVLDVGCGPADILEYLPDVRYFGGALSDRYIAAGRKRYGDRGQFECKPVAALTADRPRSFDIV